LRGFDFSRVTDMAFLVALVGWMPGPLDISIWSSLWSQEKNQEMQRRLTLKEALFDFKFGYIGTTYLAVVFLSLGALIMWPQGKVFSSSAVAFSRELIDLYSSQLGSWSRPFIAFAATATMISTTITCLDAFPRVLKASFANLDQTQSAKWNHQTYFLVLVTIGTMVLIQFFLSSMKDLVDMATTVSFLVAPIIAILNHRVMMLVTDPAFAWGKGMRSFSYLCLVVLVGFTGYYLVLKI
jgi:Mn2+/Fe2+ NRAMP family transporter